MWKKNYRKRTIAPGHQQVGVDHDLLVVPARQHRLVGGGQQWSSQVHARFGSELSVGSSLQWQGCPFVTSLSSYHLQRPCCHTLFTIFILPLPHHPLLAFPHIFSHFVHILLHQTSALCSAPGESDWDWGLCPPSPREFLDP